VNKNLTTKFTKMSSKYSKRFLFIAWCALWKNLAGFVVNKTSIELKFNRKDHKGELKERKECNTQKDGIYYK